MVCSGFRNPRPSAFWVPCLFIGLFWSRQCGGGEGGGGVLGAAFVISCLRGTVNSGVQFFFFFRYDCNYDSSLETKQGASSASADNSPGLCVSFMVLLIPFLMSICFCHLSVFPFSFFLFFILKKGPSVPCLCVSLSLPPYLSL